ncbi:MAG: type-F conjugative transfer system secretin TraK [Simkaniaceae bacterium]|nr:MAG: type-F conjugative transfer system secretin TraK [Simkaniaceae bacterium]
MTSSCYCSDERVDLEKNITEINFNESGPIQVTFSNNSHNRIAWKNDRIVSVTGDERIFDVEINPKIGQAFVSVLKTFKNTTATLTVVSSQGLVQDIQVKSDDKPSIFLTINVPEKNDDSFAANHTHFHSQTIEFLNDILEGCVPFGYTQRVVQNFDELKLPAPLEATPLKVYENPFENVVIYEIINQGRRPLTIRSQNLKPCLNSWVFLSAQELHFRETALCIVATSK